jgi:hypothetical protein
LPAVPITVIADQVEYRFPEVIEFSLSARAAVEIQAVTLLYGTDGLSCQPSEARQPVTLEPARQVDLTWEWELKRSGMLPPGTELWWQWEITDAAGNRRLTEKQTQVLNDPRHPWQRLERQGLILQWYEGGASFGQTLFAIARQSLARLSEEAGIQPSGEIWITIYPSAEEVQEALIHTTEWTGGVAILDHGSILLGISPRDMAWAKEGIPHEISHLLFNQQVFNCQGNSAPAWLVEGIAVYAEKSLAEAELDQVKQALKEDRLPGLRALSGSFSAYSEQAVLSYLQSGFVVQYLVEEHGPEKMSRLLAEIQAGATIDAALEEVYGFDTDGLDSAWRSGLGFEPPTDAETGDQASAATPTQVPTLALWSPLSTPTAAPSETPTSTLAPASTPTAKPAALQPAATQTEPAGATAKPGSSFPACFSPLGAPLAILGLPFILGRKKVILCVFPHCIRSAEKHKAI